MHYPRKFMTYPTGMKIRIQAFNSVALKNHQWPECKMFWKRKDNGVSTPHILSMRPYAYIQAKHAKKGLLDKNMSFYLWRNLMQSQASHINQLNMITISTNNINPTYVKPWFSTTLLSRNNITRMNKSQSYNNKQHN